MNQKFWDFYAQRYDSLNHLRPYRELLAKIVYQLLCLDPSPTRILDAGCGTGSLLCHVRDLIPHCQLVGVDQSPAMLKVAGCKLKGLGVELKQGNLNQPLSFGDGSFDCLVSVNVLYALTDPLAALREFHRLLKPGGTLLLVNGICLRQSLVWQDHFLSLALGGRLADYLDTLLCLPDFAFLAAVNTLIARRVRSKQLHFLPPDDLAELVRQVGFRLTWLEPRVYSGLSCLILARREN